MTTFTVLVLLFGWGVQPWVWAAAALFVVVGIAVQAALLFHCASWKKWLFLLGLAVFWIPLEIAGGFSVNYAQVIVLFALGAVLALAFGALLGTVGYAVGIRGKKNRKEDTP